MTVGDSGMKHEPSPRRTARPNRLGKTFGSRSPLARQARALLGDDVALGLNAYDALLVKLLVGQVMARRLAVAGPARELLGASTTTALGALLRRLDVHPLLTTLTAGLDGAADPLAPLRDAWSDAAARWVRDVAAAVANYPTGDLASLGRDGDVFGRLHHDLLPKRLRHAQGEYYTPDWLAEHVLDQVGYSGDGRLLDPTCGSGVFLMAALRRIRAAAPGTHASKTSRELAERMLANVAGFDLSPLAVLAARANYLLTLADFLPPDAALEIPVYQRDAIIDDARPGERFDYVVGNPPWVAWDHLAPARREATAPLWRRYGLFSLSANDARHGGAKKDLSMLVLYAAADRWLKNGGRLGFVITQTLFQTKGAGDGFRRFRLGPSGEPLKVLRVDDLVRCKPFSEASNWTATIALEKGRETSYPVPYIRWTPLDAVGGDSVADGAPRAGSGSVRRPRAFTRQPCTARPIDPARSRSSWLVLGEGEKESVLECVGPSDYTAHLGANTGGANGVYWVHVLEHRDGGVLVRNLPGRGKRAVEQVEFVIEPDLLYPLLRWRDVARWRAAPHAWIILPQDVHARRGIDEAVLRRNCPRTLAYLERFRDVLAARAAYRRYQHAAAFYSMYNVGPYTTAATKVVWRRMDTRIRAAVVEPVVDPLLGRRPVVAQETCVEIEVASADEAHYVAAVLNSRATGALVAAHSVHGGKGFGTPSMLDYAGLGRYDPADATHAALAEAGRAAHRAAAAGADVAPWQSQIDALAAQR